MVALRRCSKLAPALCSQNQAKLNALRALELEELGAYDEDDGAAGAEGNDGSTKLEVAQLAVALGLATRHPTWAFSLSNLMLCRSGLLTTI